MAAIDRFRDLSARVVTVALRSESSEACSPPEGHSPPISSHVFPWHGERGSLQQRRRERLGKTAATQEHTISVAGQRR